MPSLGPPVALQRALAESLTTGSFIDTKFYVFSRRRSSEAKVDKPRALWANSSVLKERSAYFATMFSSGFSETALKNGTDGFPENETPYVDDYDYYSDSDLEDDVEDDLLGDSPSELIDGSLPVPPESSVTVETTTNPTRLGRVIIIRDAAYLTFKAMLGFIHTCDIEFGGFGRKDSVIQNQDDGRPRPSPKSIYRLADKYGLEDLKALAYEDIQLNLSSCDIIEEIFSEFTSWYPEIRNLEIREFKQTLGSRAKGSATEKLMIKLDRFGHGDFPHSSESVVALLNMISLGKLDNSITSKSQSPLQTPEPPYWSDLKKAIMNSLCSGKFIDNKICTNSIRTSSKETTGPLWLYFSRIALDSCYEKLSHHSLKSKFSTCSNPTAIESDSDLEEEDDTATDPGLKLVEAKVEPESPLPMQALDTLTSRLNHARQETEFATPLYINIGAYKTWKSALYYIYTGDVSFAPLRSQGSDSHVEDISEQNNSAVPLCSPKSMYIIAELLGLQRLQQLSRDDITSKIGADNVVEEIFSVFSSSCPRVLQVETQVLYKHRATSTIIENINNKIRAVAGQDSHQSEALKSVFMVFVGGDSLGELECAECHYIGAKVDFEKYRECPKCPEQLLQCTICNHEAEFRSTWEDVGRCPKCGIFLSK